jgi:hypothetical protein
MDDQVGAEIMIMGRQKVVMHAHSVWSHDGRWRLERIARVYGRLGARVVMMSEHDTGFMSDRFNEYREACADAITSDCTLVPGIEYSSPDNDIHVLTWGLAHFLGDGRPVMDTLRDARDLGGVTILAHPIRRNAWQKVKPEWLTLLNGIELWNRKSDGIAWGHEALKLIRQSDLPAYVGHDFHSPRQIWPLWQSFDLPLDSRGRAMESVLVDRIKCGAATPYAFGRPLLDDRGAPRPAMLPTLEAARKRLIKWLR